MFLRTFSFRNMYGVRLWLAAAALQAAFLAANCINHHRRTMPTQATLTVSKSGWRPVVGSGSLLYSFNNAPIHQQNYKIPVPVLDPALSYTSSRPVPTRETTKLSPATQTYKTTTLRTLPSPTPVPNQPIHSYLNPFALPNNGLAHFKYVGNYPMELLRNPYNPFLRPVYSKLPTKYKQSLQNLQYQQLTNVQPIQFGQYQVPKPVDIFGNPTDNFSKQESNKQQSTVMEIYKPEVYKIPDSVVQQAVTQQVKTAQQQHSLLGNVIPAFNAYPHFSFQEALHPPSILGTFNTFGVQTVKGREPAYPTKTTYLPPPPTKQTVFNSFGYNPTYKSTPTHFTSTTPRYTTTTNPNNLVYGSTFSDYKLTPTPYSKKVFPSKIDPNSGAKDNFKPSIQDPFIKSYNNDYNKITTYNPVTQTTTVASNYFDYNFPQNTQLQNYYNHNSNKHENQNANDNAAGSNQQTKQNINAPQSQPLDGSLHTPYRATYEVTESTDPEQIAHSSEDDWTIPSQVYDFNDHRTTPQPTKKQEYVEPTLSKPSTTSLPEPEEEFTIVTESEKSYEDSLNYYNNNVESQSRRPLGDDFEPIGKYKLKDYYYKVSTPAYDYYNTRRTKKPSESTRVTVVETTTEAIRQTDDVTTEVLPTLPPNQHFKRPNNQEGVDKDKIRKRNKNRRRRPGQVNPNYNRMETSTATTTQAARETIRTDPTQTTESEEIYTIRPRPRPTKTTYETYPTIPSVTTDLTTSALPTVTPTRPTTVKKLAARRPLTTTTTTTDRPETTTFYNENETNKDSSIMKIGTTRQLPKTTVTVYEFRTSQAPDYTHKQDEKDTPTSDVAVSLTDTFKTTVASAQGFSFHKDVKPIEAITYHPNRETTTEFFKETISDTEITTLRTETTSNTERSQRLRLRNKYNRPKFSVKDYRNRMVSTTSTTEKPAENVPRIRFPQRRLPYSENTETTTERKRFTPKEPRHKVNGTEFNEETEKEIHSFRQPLRQVATENDGAPLKISSRIRQSSRRKPVEETTDNSSTSTVHNKRPLRRKVIQDSEPDESVQDVSVIENLHERSGITSERSRSESAIMKIADKKHQQDPIEHLFEHSKRVSDLTLAASKDYNKPGMFKTVASNSRRIPNYFTIATDDPILPIEAFFPQLNQKKES